jgi:glycosyltransferase involved in cell wall biosynthesis
MYDYHSDNFSFSANWLRNGTNCVIMVPGTDNEPYEGLTRHVFEISKRLGRRGFKVLNVAPSMYGSQVLRTVDDSYILLQVPVPSLPRPATLLNKIDTHLGAVPYFLNYRNVVNRLLVGLKEPLILHTHSFHTIAQPAKPNKLCKRLATVHGFGNIDAKGKGLNCVKTKFLGLMLKRVYQRADYYTTQSENMKSMMVRFYEIDACKISVVPHGVDSGFFSPGIDSMEARMTEKKFNLNKPHRVLFLGHLFKGKGHKVLLKAFRILQARRKDVLLVLKIGKVRDYDEIPRLVTAFRISNNVRIISRNLSMNELKSLYKVSNAYVNYHLLSGHSTAVLEAMASGVPPIIHKDSPNVDVADKSCGIILETMDPKELAAAVDSLIDDKTYAGRLSRNAMIRTRREHDWDEVVVPRYVSVYRSLMEE